MRNAFAEELTNLARENSDIQLLSGDIGNRLFDKFKEFCPNNFLNCGVAEQNMIGVAAGMALSGLRPIAYTITSFITTRCFEQIKLDVGYHNLPVIIVGVGSGLCYAGCGPTHHSCEDIALLRTIPNMTIFCPGDANEVRAALRAAIKHPGPVYIRLGKKNEPLVHDQIPEITIGKCIPIKEGDNICLLNTGNTLALATETASQLDSQQLSTGVIHFPTVKPLDTEILKNIFSKFKVVVTLEEHCQLGGLGSCVAEWLAEQPPQKARLLRIGTPDKFICQAGSHDHLRQKLGIDPHQIIKKITLIYNSE